MDGQTIRYKIDFSNEAAKTIKKWKKSNPVVFKKLYNILPELESHPKSGTGHPEPLRGKNNITWSRRLTSMHRIIYDIYDDEITVLILTQKVITTINKQKPVLKSKCFQGRFLL